MTTDPTRSAPTDDAVIDYLDERDPETDAYWQGLLSGEIQMEPGSRFARAIFRHLPSNPRCKWCYAPYGKPFGPIVGSLGWGPWEKNPTLCGRCLHDMEEHQGGAEVEVAVMFADLRGSTEIAASMSAAAYTRMLNTYYAIAGAAVQAQGGIVDKYLGDGVLALFLRGFIEAEPAGVAVEAARRILREVEHHRDLPADRRPLPVGIGIHYGVAYVGIVGSEGQPTNFTALGDAVNVAERVSSEAAAGELLVSEAAALQLEQPLEGAESRRLELKGVAEPLTAWSVRPAVAEKARTT